LKGINATQKEAVGFFSGGGVTLDILGGACDSESGENAVCFVERC
jgi:hypothetical protein